MHTYLQMINLRVEFKKFMNNPKRESLMKEMLSEPVIWGHSLSNSEFIDLKKTINKSDKRTFGQYLQNLVDSKKVIKDSIIYTNANITKEYWNKLLHDKFEKPSKNKLIRIGFALELNVDEMNELLKRAGHSFRPDSQDCAIYWFFAHGVYEFDEINELLGLLNLSFIYDNKELD